MYEFSYRLLVILWFLSYMATIYLALHIVVARFSRAPEGRLVWFFSVATGPLILPARALLPPETSEPRLRLVTFGVCVALWLGLRLLLSRMGGLDLG